jgi:hypothetical protein
MNGTLVNIKAESKYFIFTSLPNGPNTIKIAGKDKGKIEIFYLYIFAERVKHDQNSRQR